ncbi:MAG: PhoH family protein, partial [Cyanobacteria bacterium P01_E01_bin.43]
MQQTAHIDLPSSESAIALSGHQNENIKLLSQQSGAQIVLRGRDLLFSGTASTVSQAKQIVMALEPLWGQGTVISRADILTARQALNTDQLDELRAIQSESVTRTRRGEVVRAKTFRQRKYIQALQKNDLIFCSGPAGTGKTFLAAMVGVQALINDEYERLILTRPAVEAGERLGFLPGDLQQKVNPYLRPLYDALHELIDPEK